MRKDGFKEKELRQKAKGGVFSLLVSRLMTPSHIYTLSVVSGRSRSDAESHKQTDGCTDLLYNYSNQFQLWSLERREEGLRNMGFI